jgi:hypothetical protein
MNWTECRWPGCRNDVFAVWGYRCAAHTAVPWPTINPRPVGTRINLGVGERR